MASLDKLEQERLRIVRTCATLNAKRWHMDDDLRLVCDQVEQLGNAVKQIKETTVRLDWNAIGRIGVDYHAANQEMKHICAHTDVAPDTRKMCQAFEKFSTTITTLVNDTFCVMRMPPRTRRALDHRLSC